MAKAKKRATPAQACDRKARSACGGLGLTKNQFSKCVKKTKRTTACNKVGGFPKGGTKGTASGTYQHKTGSEHKTGSKQRTGKGPQPRHGTGYKNLRARLAAKLGPKGFKVTPFRPAKAAAYTAAKKAAAAAAAAEARQASEAALEYQQSE